MTREEAYERLHWYFEEGPGTSADNKTKGAFTLIDTDISREEAIDILTKMWCEATGFEGEE